MSKKKIDIIFELKKHPDKYLELWKYFSDDGNKVKDKMWTMASFFFTALGVLLGFAAEHISSGGDADVEFTFDDPTLILIISILGIILSSYVMFMLVQYGYHIRASWNRANYIRRHIKGFTEIWYLENKEEIDKEKSSEIDDRNLPKLAKRLIYLMAAFVIIYLIMLIMVII